MKNSKTKFGLKVIKASDDFWSFCLGLSHALDETYLYINFFKWTVCIGVLYKDRFGKIKIYDDSEF